MCVNSKPKCPQFWKNVRTHRVCRVQLFPSLVESLYHHLYWLWNPNYTFITCVKPSLFNPVSKINFARSSLEKFVLPRSQYLISLSWLHYSLLHGLCNHSKTIKLDIFKLIVKYSPADAALLPSCICLSNIPMVKKNF